MFNPIIISIVVATFVDIAGHNNTYTTKFAGSQVYERSNTISDTCFTAIRKLTESNNEEDMVINEYLLETLSPIRSNYKKINSIEVWTSVVSKDIFESTEGGEVVFYYTNNVLEKIINRNYGETYQELTEYYFLNEELSFVVERSCKYNRPLYYDSLTMIELNDTEVFDVEKSIYSENRSYFDKKKLIHQINSEDCGAPFSESYLEEEELRIKSNLQSILKFEK